MGRPRLLLPWLAATLVAAATAAAQTGGGTPTPPTTPPPPQNPCTGEEAYELRCPDFVMKRPHGLIAEGTRRGRVVLRAGNAIDNVGRGPAELHGVRTSRRFMRARQRIYTNQGRRIGVRTGARLLFKYGHERRHYWKFYKAARFELWRLDAAGQSVRRVRTGPKITYCLRDLRRTRPRRRYSPRRRVYPACNTNFRKRRVTLGTSVGWSDIYPPSYPEQWIDVTGLRGCFAYVHIADPQNGLWESNEENNLAQVIVRLPFDPTNRRGGCPGRDLGGVHRETGPY
jgi:hypothetical protein